MEAKAIRSNGVSLVEAESMHTAHGTEGSHHQAGSPEVTNDRPRDDPGRGQGEGGALVPLGRLVKGEGETNHRSPKTSQPKVISKIPQHRQGKKGQKKIDIEFQILWLPEYLSREGRLCLFPFPTNSIMSSRWIFQQQWGYFFFYGTLLWSACGLVSEGSPFLPAAGRTVDGAQVGGEQLNLAIAAQRNKSSLASDRRSPREVM